MRVHDGSGPSGTGTPPTYDPSMLLAIDIGNTNLTLALVRDGALRPARRATTIPGATTDELELLLADMVGLDGGTLADVDAMALASVVPSLTAAVEGITSRRGIALLVAAAGTVPLAIRVDRPGDVGADRIVNALATARLHGTPAVVVDVGTATTLDCIGPDGAYLGGSIAPGLELGLEALAARTAKLPRIELRTPDRAIGRDTVSAMQSGTVFGYQALVAGLLSRVRDELAQTVGCRPEAVHTVLTGGLSLAPWAKDVEGVDAIDPDLTLKGLAILYAEVAGGDPIESLRP